MKIFHFNGQTGRRVTKYGSNFILNKMIQTEQPAQIVHMDLNRGDNIGAHETHVNQLLIVTGGSGYVRGCEDIWYEVSSGEAVGFSAGEIHETRTDSGLTAIVIESESMDPGQFMEEKER